MSRSDLVDDVRENPFHSQRHAGPRLCMSCLLPDEEAEGGRLKRRRTPLRSRGIEVGAVLAGFGCHLVRWTLLLAVSVSIGFRPKLVFGARLLWRPTSCWSNERPARELMLLPDGVAMGMRNCSGMRLANLAAGRRPPLGRPGPRWSTCGLGDSGER
jgi:hypothetical protein